MDSINKHLAAGNDANVASMQNVSPSFMARAANQATGKTSTHIESSLFENLLQTFEQLIKVAKSSNAKITPYIIVPNYDYYSGFIAGSAFKPVINSDISSLPNDSFILIGDIFSSKNGKAIIEFKEGKKNESDDGKELLIAGKRFKKILNGEIKKYQYVELKEILEDNNAKKKIDFLYKEDVIEIMDEFKEDYAQKYMTFCLNPVVIFTSRKEELKSYLEDLSVKCKTLKESGHNISKYGPLFHDIRSEGLEYIFRRPILILSDSDWGDEKSLKYIKQLTPAIFIYEGVSVHTRIKRYGKSDNLELAEEQTRLLDSTPSLVVCSWRKESDIKYVKDSFSHTQQPNWADYINPSPSTYKIIEDIKKAHGKNAHGIYVYYDASNNAAVYGEDEDLEDEL